MSLQGRGRTRPFLVLEGRLNPFVLAKVKGRGPCHCSFEGNEGPHLPLSVKRRPAPSFVNNIGKGPPLCSLKGEGGGPVPSFVLRSNGPAFVFFPMRRDATHFSCEGRVGPCLLLSAKGEPSPFVVSKVTAIKGNRAIVLSREMQGLRPFLCLLKEGPSDCSFRAALSKVRGKKVGLLFFQGRRRAAPSFVL